MTTDVMFELGRLTGRIEALERSVLAERDRARRAKGKPGIGVRDVMARVRLDDTAYQLSEQRIQASLDQLAEKLRQSIQPVLEATDETLDVQDRLGDGDDRVVGVDGVVQGVRESDAGLSSGRDGGHVESGQVTHDLAPSSLAGTESVGPSSASHPSSGADGSTHGGAA